MQLTPLNSLFSKTTWVSRYQKGKTSLDLNEARDYGVLGWQWHQLDHMQTICTSLQTDNHINTSSINFYRPDALLTPNEQCQSTQGKMTSCKNWKNTILKQKFITNWNIQRNSTSVSFNIPGTNLTPNHQDTGMMPWWKTWRKLTWLYFLRKMKNIYISYTHLLNNTLYKVVQHHLSATKTRQMARELSQRRLLLEVLPAAGHVTTPIIIDCQGCVEISAQWPPRLAQFNAHWVHIGLLALSGQE